MSKLFTNPNIAVDGFEPQDYVKEYVNSNGEVLARLPFNAQLMWFRLRYPEGKVAVETRPCQEAVIAKARLYVNRTDAVDAYISEGEASRGFSADMPTVNPRIWAQTAAIATALRYAGFGLEYDLAGDEPVSVTAEWDALMSNESPPENSQSKKTFAVDENGEVSAVEQNAPDYDKMSSEEAVAAASNAVCHRGKYNGKTLSEILVENKGYAGYVLKKFDSADPLYKAAKVLVDAAQRYAE